MNDGIQNIPPQKKIIKSIKNYLENNFLIINLFMYFFIFFQKKRNFFIFFLCWNIIFLDYILLFF